MSRRPKEKISNEFINLLKDEVINRFGRKIKSTPDCKVLEDSIYLYTGQLLSYNTMRRFFGLVKTSSIINKSSLDILSNYCGYSNFDLFSSRINKLEINELNNYFINLFNEKKINFKEIEIFCNKYGDWPQIYPFIEKCLLFSQNINDVSFLISFYSLPVIFEYSPNKLRYIFDLAQLFASIVKNLPVNIKEKIIYKIASLPNARKRYIEMFVDIDNINGFYSTVLEAHHKHSKAISSLLFYYNLNVYKSFISQDQVGLKAFYSELQKVQYNSDKIFPILLGRTLASRIYYTKCFGFVNKQALISEIGEQLKIYGKHKKQSLLFSQLYLIYILQALQFTGELDLLSEIFKAIKPLVLNVSDYLTENATNHIKIYWAHHFINSNNLKEAEKVINTITPNKFPAFEKLTQTISYNLMLKDYYQKTGNYELTKKMKNNVIDLATNRGFKLFIE